jgi:IS30 family transposase
MSKLTKKDKYAIQYLHAQNKQIKDISIELNLSESQIKRYLLTIESSAPETKEIKTDKTKNLMIRHTSDKKHNTVSIMTQGASQVGDDFYKHMNSSVKNTDGYIYRRP